MNAVGEPVTFTAAIETQLGVSARVVVLTGDELRTVVAENPVDPVTEPSRLLVAFPQRAEDLKKLDPLVAQDWSPSALHVTPHAAFVWCPAGILESALPDALAKLMRDAVTSRNWATVKKLEAML